MNIDFEIVKDKFEKRFGKKWMIGDDFTLHGMDTTIFADFVYDIADVIWENYQHEIPDNEEEFDKLVWKE